MGGVTSSPADSSSPVFIKAPSKFLINTLLVSTPSVSHPQTSSERHIIGPPNGPSLILPNHAPLLKSTIDSSSLSVSTQSLDSKTLVQYIQDPDPKSSGLILKIPENAVLKFTISIQTSAVPIENLTFIAAPSCSSLENLLVNEFLENPNIQNEENVVLLGDFESASSSPTTFEFVWKTYPPLSSSLFKPDERGMKLVLCFAEYDKRDHSLKQLARFSVWLDHAQPPAVPPKVNTSLETLPELSELSPILSTSPSPVFRDLPTGLGYPYYFPNDINRIANSRSGSPTVAKRNSIDNHSFPPPPNFPAPPIPSSASPDDFDSEQAAVTLSQPVSSMIIPDKNVEDIDPREKRLPPPPPLQIQQQSVQPPLQSPAHTSNTTNSSIPRPQENSSSQPEDGPLFRATIASLEKKTGLLKVKVKKLLKRALMMHERQNSLIEAHALFLQSVQEIADSGVTSFQPLVSNFYNSKANGPYVALDLLRRSTADLNENVIIPLRKFYDQEIKSFDQRKKEFDDESREYYAWLSRYLSVKQEAKGKKKSESDSKYAERRKAFELRRFDYYSYFQDLHGGRKQQIVISKMALFAEQEMNRHIAVSERLQSGFKENLLAFVTEIQDSSKEWNRQRTEREEHRRLIERPPTKESQVDVISPTNDKFPSNIASMGNMNISIPSTTTNSNYNNINSALPVSLNDDHYHTNTSPISISNTGLSHSSPLSSVIPIPSSIPDSMRVHSPGPAVGSPEKNIMSPIDLDSKSAESNRRKEGLLWALSRPGGLNEQINLNKTGGWHKFWVVLAAGKLCEYTNWKQGVDLHNDPINLKVALVREARNAERRFCFEVVTPQYKRVYQATSEEDMQSWIRSINNGISSSLEGSSHSMKDYTISPESASIRPIHTNQSAQYESKLSPVSTIARLPDEPVDNNLGDLKEEFAKLNSRKVSLHRRTSTQKNVTEKMNSYKPSISIKPIKTQPEKKSNTRISEIVYNLDTSNRYCADCGSSSKVEWISINLLCILCIECSGVHRSLGSHISKVRSLTLDTVSFTPEVVTLIKSVNNSIINSIWEATLPHPKNPVKVTENRAAFIREKYIEKKYVQILDRPNAYLRTEVQNKDVIGILRALASRANTNILIDTGEGEDKTEESIIIYSLRTAPASATVFPIVELLLLNTPEHSSLPLTAASGAHMSSAAWQYLQSKLGNKSVGINAAASAKPTPPGANVISPTLHAQPAASATAAVSVSSNSGNTPTRPSTGKFQKRLSFGK